jgi:hypothetical protein
VKKIVEDHAGILLLDDAPGGGALMTLRFQHAVLAAQLGSGTDDDTGADSRRQRVTHGL